MKMITPLKIFDCNYINNDITINQIKNESADNGKDVNVILILACYFYTSVG